MPEDNSMPIQVWAFYDAPKHLQEMSTNGGDEDWLAVLPPNYKDNPPWWMEEGSRFGCCSVDYIPHPKMEGFTVAIGSHA